MALKLDQGLIVIRSSNVVNQITLYNRKKMTKSINVRNDNIIAC